MDQPGTRQLGPGPWTSHGHDIPGVTVAGPGRPPVARCGGPGLCSQCSAEASLAQHLGVPPSAVSGASGWLDPEPPHAEHTETECRRELPHIRQQDSGRRYACGVCGRVYRATPGNQREPKPYWVTQPLPGAEATRDA